MTDKPKSKTGIKIALIVFFILVLLAGATIALGFYADSKLYGIIPRYTKIAGIDVSNMHPDEAAKVVTDELNKNIQGYTLTITGGEQDETIDLSKQLSFDITDQIDAAVEPSMEPDTFDRIVRALKIYSGYLVPEERDFDVTYRFESLSLDEKVAELAAQINKDPVDATRKISGDTVTITPEEAGQYVDTEATVEKINEELKQFDGGQLPKEKHMKVALVVETAAPEVTADSFGPAITINLSSHKLYLFEGAELVKTYNIGGGRPGYETPTGLLKIVNKRKNPTWVNPNPEGWGSTMPERIGPGPDNPLGLRALDLNRRAIRIHGVSDPGRIGRNRSHGCINMMNADVVDLFDRVPVGTPVNVHW